MFCSLIFCFFFGFCQYTFCRLRSVWHPTSELKQFLHWIFTILVRPSSLLFQFVDSLYPFFTFNKNIYLLTNLLNKPLLLTNDWTFPNCVSSIDLCWVSTKIVSYSSGFEICQKPPGGGTGFCILFFFFPQTLGLFVIRPSLWGSL